jgi:hypothetical protein
MIMDCLLSDDCMAAKVTKEATFFQQENDHGPQHT